MTLTIDASVAMAVILNEPARAQLISETRGQDLISAPTLPWEVGNALSALLKRRRLDVDTARRALRAFERIAVRLPDVRVDRSVRLAAEHDIYAYDAYVIECARRYRTPLLSLDRRQCEAARDEGIEVIEVDALRSTRTRKRVVCWLASWTRRSRARTCGFAGGTGRSSSSPRSSPRVRRWTCRV